MTIRESLLPRKPDRAMRKKLIEIGDSIADAVEAKRDASELLAQFNALAANKCELRDFCGAEGYDMRYYVESALTPYPLRVYDVTDEEFIEIIDHIKQGIAPDWESGYWIQFLELNIPTMGIHDLIYFNSRELTAVQILEEARRWRPIILG